MLPRRVGRYAIFDEFAHGGMASVHLGRACGAAGFSRTVAVKQLHPPYSRDQSFIAMLMDEASLTARIHHPNVVSTLDVCELDGELLVVMEYVLGVPLSVLTEPGREDGSPIDPRLASAIMVAVLRGLHAAHEAHDEQGQPLGIVHRDVSPQNVLVSADGIARVIDFGVAKAARRIQQTQDGTIKGKMGYSAPEQLFGEDVDRRADVYSAAVMLWELLVGERLFVGRDGQPALLVSLRTAVDPPSFRRRGLPSALDGIVLRALEQTPQNRFRTAEDMADAIVDAIDIASNRELAQWVDERAGDILSERRAELARVEAVSFDSIPPLPQPTDLDSASVNVVAEPLPTEEEARPRRTWVVAVAGALAGAAIAAFAAWMIANRAVTPVSRGPDAPIVSEAGDASEEDVGLDTSPRQDEPETGTHRPPVTPPTVARPPVTRPPAAPPPNCIPPFVIDESGRKRYKRECFRK